MNPSDDQPLDKQLNEVPDDDHALGELLGASLRDHVEAPGPRPETAQVFELAARTQRRQRLASVAAAAVLLVGAGVAWTQLNDPKTESLIADQPEPTQQATPAPTSAAAATAPAVGSTPAPVPNSGPDDAPNPADYSDGPAPLWQAAEAPFADQVVDQLVSLDDGRVAVFTSAPTDSGQRALWISNDGRQWASTATLPVDLYVEDIAAVDQTLYAVAVRRPVDQFNGHAGWSVLSEIDVLLLTSSDQGQTWDEQVLPTDSLGTVPAGAAEFSEVIHIGSSIEVANGNVVVTAASNTELSLERLIDARGLRPAGSEWIGVDYGPGEVVAYFADPANPNGPALQVPLSAEELGIDLASLEPAMNAKLVAWKLQPNGLVQEVHQAEGWASLSSDGMRFYLSGFDDVGAAWWSDDGDVWNSLAADPGAGDVAGYGERLYRVSWRAGAQGVEVSADAGQSWELVRDFDQLSISGIEAGGAGLASVAFVSSNSFDDVDLSPVVVSKEGYTLTVNYNPQSAVLIDDSTGEAVLSFTEEQMMSDIDSPGVDLNEVTGDLTFSDPVTGEVYLVVADAEFSQAGELASTSPTSVDVLSTIPEQWVGWSADGTAWSWQALSDVLNAGPGSFANTAVTDTTVVIVVSTFGGPQPGTDSPAPGETLVLVGEVPQ